MKLTIDDVRSRFIEHFDGTTGSVYASPGRINLTGEHTDYNDGFVPGKLQPKKILQGEGIWMIFKFAFIEFKSENYLSHCHSTNYFAEKQVVKM